MGVRELMNEVVHCDACACFITKRSQLRILSIQDVTDDDQLHIKMYALCEKCAENLKQRIRNGELTEVG